MSITQFKNIDHDYQVFNLDILIYLCLEKISIPPGLTEKFFQSPRVTTQHVPLKTYDQTSRIMKKTRY